MSEQPGLQSFPELGRYENYRRYLRAVCDQVIVEGSTMARLAETFGMARSRLSMILSGDRDLTVPAIHRVARALHLDRFEHDYFEALVLWNQATDSVERRFYQDRLSKLNAARTTRVISSPSKTLVSQWFVPALLVYLIDIQGDVEELVAVAQQLHVSGHQLRTLIEALEREGFLRLRGNGDVHISFNRVTAMVSTKRYLTSVFHQGVAEMQERFDDSESFFTAHTFSIQRRHISKFIADYKALLGTYLTLTDGQSSLDGQRAVVQANFQMFPVIVESRTIPN